MVQNVIRMLLVVLQNTAVSKLFMTKLSYIIITIVILLVLAIGITWYMQRPLATSTVVPLYTDLTVTLPSSTGAKVILPNFLKDPAVIADTQNVGLYYIGNTFPVNESNNMLTYVVTYDKNNGYFNITLLQKPLSSARHDAETYLKNLLKVDETSMCGLSYTVSVPWDVDVAASGIDYRFSFCSGSVNLP